MDPRKFLPFQLTPTSLASQEQIGETFKKKKEPLKRMPLEWENPSFLFPPN